MALLGVCVFLQMMCITTAYRAWDKHCKNPKKSWQNRWKKIEFLIALSANDVHHYSKGCMTQALEESKIKLTSNLDLLDDKTEREREGHNNENDGEEGEKSSTTGWHTSTIIGAVQRGWRLHWHYISACGRLLSRLYVAHCTRNPTSFNRTVQQEKEIFKKIQKWKLPSTYQRPRAEIFFSANWEILK